MASLKRKARVASAKVEGKTDTSTDGVLELSVTVGYLAADVSKEEISKLERLMQDHCVAGVVALERGDLEQHLHFQMVCRARVKSARSFGILVRKYMDWYGQKHMSPAGKVMCKCLTNRLIHTWKGMIGYCLKDSGTTHFEVVMHNISDHEVIAGKTLYSIYGKADLKSRVCITNKNIGERAYVWFKYKENRQLTATMLSTLTDMVNSAMFIPSATWIIPIAGLGMDHRRMESYWKCLTDPVNVTRAEIADVFIRKREYVKGRYFDDDLPPVPRMEQAEEYVYDGSPPTSNVEDVAPSGSPPSVRRKLPRTLNVPPFGSLQVKVKGEVFATAVQPSTRRKLFRESAHVERVSKSVQFSDPLADFIPLTDIAKLPTNTFLPTNDALFSCGQKQEPMSDADFWDDISNIRLNGTVPVKARKVNVTTELTGGKKIQCSGVAGESRSAAAGEKSSRATGENMNGAAGDVLKEVEIIVLSSDSEAEEMESTHWPEEAAAVSEDRTCVKQEVPAYIRGEDHVEVVLKREVPCDRRRCDDPPYQCRGKC